MNQQKRFQSNTEFIINLISLFLAHTLSIVIFGVIIKRITPYPKNDTIEYIFTFQFELTLPSVTVHLNSLLL